MKVYANFDNEGGLETFQISIPQAFSGISFLTDIDQYHYISRKQWLPDRSGGEVQKIR